MYIDNRSNKTVHNTQYKEIRQNSVKTAGSDEATIM